MPALPIIFTTTEDSAFLSQLENRIKTSPVLTKPDMLLEFPIVYIHYWPSKVITYVDKTGVTHTRQMFDIYIGESNDVIDRTNQHYNTGRKATSNNQDWQYDLINNPYNAIPEFIVIGHNHFNKSMTLDIENRLIEYAYAMKSNSIDKLLNGRGNPQGDYYPSEELDQIFSSIWRGLRKTNQDLFLRESFIKNSAIFKASPLKKLRNEQIQAKELIIQKIVDAYNTGKTGQLIFVQGESGTGKTILTTSTFYDLIRRGEETPPPGQPQFPKLSCYLMVNHDQQVKVYEDMVHRLDLGDDRASRPTKFINDHPTNQKVDVAFIDEGHLLWTQPKQSYTGKNQLQDIIDRSRVTVIMFDEYQVLTTEEYWEPAILSKFINLSKSQGNYIQLKTQQRMVCAPSTEKWIQEFTINKNLTAFSPDAKGYKLKAFDKVDDLYLEIKKMAGKKGSELSRIVATYDWDYNDKHRPVSGGTWDVSINGWNRPWNYELEKSMTAKQKRSIKHMAWAEQPHTLEEVGSTFTIQGFDLSYVGVILGPSVTYRNGKIVFDASKKKYDKMTRNRSLSNGTKQTFGEIFTRNEIKILMSRGVKGLYIYACDKELRDALKNIARI